MKRAQIFMLKWPNLVPFETAMTLLADLRKNPSYLVSLTANEREQEAELTREVTQLYDSFKSRNPLTETFNSMAGGLDKTWTHVGG
jgi:hypothetical protein